MNASISRIATTTSSTRFGSTCGSCPRSACTLRQPGVCSSACSAARTYARSRSGRHSHSARVTGHVTRHPDTCHSGPEYVPTTMRAVVLAPGVELGGQVYRWEREHPAPDGLVAAGPRPLLGAAGALASARLDVAGVGRRGAARERARAAAGRRRELAAVGCGPRRAVRAERRAPDHARRPRPDTPARA